MRTYINFAYLIPGSNILQTLRYNRDTLKGAHRRLIDLANTLGLSNATISLIERRVAQDKYVLFGGMFVTLTVIVFVVMFLLWELLGVWGPYDLTVSLTNVYLSQAAIARSQIGVNTLFKRCVYTIIIKVYHRLVIVFLWTWKHTLVVSNGKVFYNVLRLCFYTIIFLLQQNNILFF